MAFFLFLPLFVASIVGAGGMKMAIPGMKVEHRKRLVKPGIGTVDKRCLVVFVIERIVERAKMFEATFALEALKISRALRDMGVVLKVLILEKTTPRFHFDQGSLDAVLLAFLNSSPVEKNGKWRNFRR